MIVGYRKNKSINNIKIVATSIHLYTLISSIDKSSSQMEGSRMHRIYKQEIRSCQYHISIKLKMEHHSGPKKHSKIHLSCHKKKRFRNSNE